MNLYSVILKTPDAIEVIATNAATRGDVFKNIYQKYGPVLNPGMSEDHFILWCTLWSNEPTPTQSVTVTDISVA